jgi:pimeloyl-ACP methyl ester carboxylesterase
MTSGANWPGLTFHTEDHKMKKLRFKDENVVSYAEYGVSTGFPILIQHGLIASIKDSDLFESLIKMNRRLICIARPGYGDSSPYLMNRISEWGEIITVIINELDLNKFDVLGMSSGAPYGYAIGYKHPEKVRNIYVYSGTPALYDEVIQSKWPYAITKDKEINEFKKIAYSVFFSDVNEDQKKNSDIKDSMMNDCFGVALDLKIRFMDWGFTLSEVKSAVFMQHSRTDDAVPIALAERTAQLLPNCTLQIVEDEPHFSIETLNKFIQKTIG